LRPLPANEPAANDDVPADPIAAQPNEALQDDVLTSADVLPPGTAFAARNAFASGPIRPSGAVFSSDERFPAGDVLPALSAQIDLRQVISQGGFDVFVDPTALPLRATRTTTAAPQSPASAVTGIDPALTGWRPALSGAPKSTSASGRVPAGTLLNAVAPADAWELTGPHGATVHASTAFGYASTFKVTRPGAVTVSFVGSGAHGFEVALETAAWIIVAAALAGRAWWLDWWWGPLGGSSAKRRRRARHAAAPSQVEPVAESSPEPSDSMSEVVT